MGNFELMVMLALIRLGDNAYGVPISEEIGRVTVGQPQIKLESRYVVLREFELTIDEFD